MSFKTTVRKDQYHDSVRLMNISREASSLEGVSRVLALLGTEGNKKILRDLGFADEAVEGSTPSDLIICVETDSDGGFEAAVQEVDRLLNEASHASSEQMAAQSLDEAVQEMPSATFALVSIPGEFARLEVTEALEKGLNVMLFSDNVSIEDELFLKDLAISKGLLMMGPDCGTAIINGVPLAFANVVARGGIGIVGASGTGIQEITCLIDRMGGGVSHAIGVGGRDLSEKIGGRMMVSALKMLAEDPSTTSLVLISKPGAPDSTKRVLREARKTGLPTVVCLLGKGELPRGGRGLTFVKSLEEAALAAMGKKTFAKPRSRELNRLVDQMPAGRKYLRGLFSGGTLCYEALLLMDGAMKVKSNIGSGGRFSGKAIYKGHYCLDLGSDEFTQGRPHPMIDSTLRQEYLVDAYRDPSSRVILLDVVLGYGSTADPAGDMAAALVEARQTVAGDGPIVLAHVCGTEGDPQSMELQEAKLREAGVFLFPTNAEAVRAALDAIRGQV